MKISERFNPHKRFRGIFVPEAVCKYRGLSPGAKLVYGRLCRYAGKEGKVYPATKTLAEEVGLSERQAREYVQELERGRFIEVDRENKHYRKNGSGGTNTYFFLWHAAFEGDRGAPHKTPPPRQSTGGVPRQFTAAPTPAVDCRQRESICLRESGKESQVKADIQPTNRKIGDSPAVGGPQVAEKPKTETPRAESPAGVAASKPLPVEKETAMPACRWEWADEELAAAEDFLSDHMPEVLEEWEQYEKVPDWLPQATLDAGLGAMPEEVLIFVQGEIDAGWNPPNWKSYPAVIRHEFERRRNRVRGKRWSDSDLATVRAGVQQFMEGDEPPERFEHSCELRANGASAREVLDLIERRWRNKKYRPGGQHGPRGWNWFLQVIGNEFSATERSHLSEPPATPRSERQATADEVARGIDVLDSLVASYICKCGAEIRQYGDSVVGTCTCGRAKPVTRAAVTQMPTPGEDKRRLSGGGRQ